MRCAAHEQNERQKVRHAEWLFFFFRDPSERTPPSDAHIVE